MNDALPLLILWGAFLAACFIYAIANDIARLTHHAHQQRGEGERGGVRNPIHNGCIEP